VATALLGHEGIDANEADSRGGTPLHYAADEGHVEVVTALLGHKRIQINRPNRDGVTPLHLAASFSPEIVTMLLAQEGIDANKADNDGRTALLALVDNFSSAIFSLPSPGLVYATSGTAPWSTRWTRSPCVASAWRLSESCGTTGFKIQRVQY
jgi:hypothetical protein